MGEFLKFVNKKYNVDKQSIIFSDIFALILYNTLKEKMKKNPQYYVGIDVGGTKIAAILANAEGKIINRLKSATPKDSSPAGLTRIISDLFEELRHNSDLKRKDISAIGIGIPGIVDIKGERIIKTPNLKLSGVNLKRILENRLRIKCFIGNDANLGLLGEKWLGVAKNIKNVIGVFIGTGIGGGIIIDDKLIIGTHGASAELGHMIIKNDGPRCSCGNIGCLEALAGRWAIERNIRTAIKDGKKTIITKLLDKNTNTIKSKILKKALNYQDELTIKILTKAAKQLGVACITLRHIFDPEMIVLGGGVIKACGDFILPIVKRKVRKDKFFHRLGECKIVKSLLGDDAVVLGAVAFAKNAQLNNSS